jgi:N-methylhydantoinase B
MGGLRSDGQTLCLLRNHRRRHGRSAAGDGLSGVQVHMTNTLNTPVEALEIAFPFRVRRYGLRAESGGAGQQRGGDGIVREYELLAPVTVTMISERRARGAVGIGRRRPCFFVTLYLCGAAEPGSDVFR